MEWVVGIQIDADACIVYVHMDDLNRCATPDPEPTWPDTSLLPPSQKEKIMLTMDRTI